MVSFFVCFIFFLSIPYFLTNFFQLPVTCRTLYVGPQREQEPPLPFPLREFHTEGSKAESVYIFYFVLSIP